MQIERRDPMAVDLSVRFYGSLVRLYPAAFRADYGELMVQAFRDSCRRADRSGSPAGLLALWARTLLDVFLSVIEQYSNRGAVMTKSRWIQLSGWFLAASGVLFVLGWLASTRPIYNEYNAAAWPVDRFINEAEVVLLILGMLFIIVGIMGLLARFGSEAGGLGRAGLTLSLAGTAAALVGYVVLCYVDTEPWWAVIMLGITTLFIGLGFFGVSCIRQKLFSRWNSLPLLISLPWPLLLLADVLLDSITGVPYNLPEAVSFIFVAVPFIGLAAIGYLLLSDRRGTQSALV